MTSAAPACVSYDRHGFTVAGRRRFLLVGTVSYFRLARSDWEERLRLFRACGFNTVDIYVPWNFHEPEEGQFDFHTGSRDLGGFLRLCGDLGLMVYLRPGPYICNEWDGGGLPAWLYTKPGVRLRQNEPNYLRCVRRYLRQIDDIAAPLLATRGGPIVLYQLENELDFYPCEDVAGYIGALRDMAREDGIDVPFTACVGRRTLVEEATGLVGGVLPTPNIYCGGLVEKEASRARDALHAARFADGTAMAAVPPFVTEMNRDEGALRRVLSVGYKGMGPFNFCGGAHFGYWNAVNNWNDCSLITTTVDFGGMVRFDGVPGPAYPGARRVASLVNTFEEPLLLADPVTSWEGGPTCSNPMLGAPEEEGRPGRIYSLEGPSGTFVFLLNGTDSPQETRVTVGGWTFPRHSTLTVRPRYSHVALANVSLRHAGLAARIVYSTAEVGGLTVEPDGARLLLYGEPGTQGEIWLAPDGEAPSEPGSQIVIVTFGEPEEIPVQVGDSTLLLQTMTRDEAGRIGLDNVRSLEPPVDLLGGEMAVAVSGPPAAPERATTWQGAGRPLEELGLLRGAGWYELQFAAPTSGDEIALPHAGDLVTAYLDDRYLGTWVVDGRPLRLPLDPPVAPGPHSLKLRAEIWGHTNFHDPRWPATHLGSLRGVWGHPVLESAALRGTWRFWPEAAPQATQGAPSAQQGSITAAPGHCAVARVSLPHPVSLGAVVTVEGANCHGEVWAGETLAGRFILGPTPKAALTAGPPNRFYVPTEYLAGDSALTLVVHSAAEGGGVTGLTAEEVMRE